MDSNVTTLIASFVLMYYGTGPIKGFSYTLCLSVVISMLTAVFLTRFLLNRAVRLGFADKGLYTRPVRKAKGSVMKRVRTMFIVPAVILLVAIVMNIAGVGLAPGIDFTGGSIVEYAVDSEFASMRPTAILCSKQKGALSSTPAPGTGSGKTKAAGRKIHELHE